MTRTSLLKKLLLPPAGLFWLVFLGAGLAAAGFVKAGLAAASLGVASLYLLFLPGIGGGLLARLDRFAPLDPRHVDTTAGTTALVILDGGRRVGAKEFGGDALATSTLERLTYAAWLHKRLPLPVAVSGNGAGALMATFLEGLFAVPVRWIEPRSRNTHESAAAIARLLRGDGFERLVLVTHYWHMPRAVASFADTGLEVVAAPMDFQRRRGPAEYGLRGLVPSVKGILRSFLAFHEGVGLLWYRWRYGHRP